ncbi:MAG: hypothetical protein A2010_15810 [Nitrospirae bacterium GWD2_57_9]|nr:MAG: hypothetical protein A2010_15810 [Nitrospirae bacterium GWD2_57_9]
MSNKNFASRPFEKLKKQLDRKQTQSPPVRPVLKKKEEHTDEELFTDAMNDVQAIEAFRNLSCARYHPKEPVTSSLGPDPDRNARAILSRIAAGELPIHLPDTQEYVEWINPDYRESIITELHQGHFAVQACLDLHGFTVPEAETEIDRFLQEAFAKGLTCVKVIHGRGLGSVLGPRVKDAMVKRLAGRYRKNIISFVTARQCDGGLGALYVLLAKRKNLP